MSRTEEPRAVRDNPEAAGGRFGVTLTPVKSGDPASGDPGPEVASTVRLLHRRRGWAWAAVVSVIALIVGAGLLGSLAPNASGAGLGVASVFLLLLAILAVVAVVVAVADTVRLHRLDADVRARASARTRHHPVTSHPVRYPPRHMVSWVFGWIMMLILLGLGVAALPGLVDGVGYVAGAEPTATFYPVSDHQSCGRGGCKLVTFGYIGHGTASGTAATWPAAVQLGQPFTVRRPLWDWGFGSELINSDGAAAGSIVAGVLFDGASVLILFAAYKLGHGWLQRRRQATGLVPG